MWLFFLNSSACLAVLLLFYKLFLEKENMHLFKRFYLLFGIAVSFAIPLVTFTYYIEPTVNPDQGIVQLAAVNEAAISLWTQYLPTLLWSIYGLGVLVFGVKFIYNLLQIKHKIKRNPKYKNRSFTNVLLSDLIVPHTFFNYIFLNRHKFESAQIPQEVFWHEETHARQKHSLDVLFMEILQVLFWFNPLIYLTKKSIKLNHEFLADQAVLNKGITTATYQQTLLAFSSNALQPQLAHALNYSLIKKRFTVMKTKTTKVSVWARSLLLLPLLAILLFSFSSKSEILLEQETKDEIMEREVQDKATPAMIAEYNAIAKKLNKVSDGKTVIKKDDIDRLKYIYNLMTDVQKKNAEPFPTPKLALPPPPPPARKVKDATPPPPPPLPDNATPEQRKKYEEAIKNYKLSTKEKNGERVTLQQIKLNPKIATKVKLAKEKVALSKVRVNAKVKPEIVRVREIKDAQIAAKVKLAKEKGALTRVRVYTDVAPVRVQVREIKEAKIAAKVKLAVEKVALSKVRVNTKVKPRTLELREISDPKIATKIRLSKEREVKIRAQKADEIKIKEIQKVKLANTLKIVEEKAKLAKLQEIEISEIPPPPPESPLEHVLKMSEKGAIFYFNGKEIPSKKAIQLVKSKRKINVSTIGPYSKQPKVHLSTKSGKDKVKEKD